MTARNLDSLFRPRSIAVVGASNLPDSIGSTVMRNLLAGGFRGPIFPVSAQGEPVAGVHAYRDVFWLPEVPDLALLCAPAETLPKLIHELGVRGTRAVAIVTSTAHAPDRGDTFPHQALVSAARPHLLRILGPNSAGIIVPRLGLNASFCPAFALPGHIAFVSQSGALMASAVSWAESRRIGFSHVVSLGDASDIDVADVLDYLGNQSDTHGILLYIESIANARKFMSAARSASRNKPVIVLKSGRTPEGARAAMRHTGRHPGNDRVFDAAIHRAGMLRAETVGELFAAAETLSRARPCRGERLIIVSNAGGAGVIATDALIAGGGELAPLSADAIVRLVPLLPASSAPENPLDLGAEATAARYAETLKALLDNSVSDAILLLHGPSGVAERDAVAQSCAEVVRDSPRNIFACWMGGESTRPAMRALQDAGVAVHDTPEAAVRAFLHIVEHDRSQEALQEAPSSIPRDFAPDRRTAAAVLQGAKGAGRTRLSDPEGKRLLAVYGIPAVATNMASSVDEAAALAAQVGYPVALKVVSPDLAHRSEVGGVMLNLESDDELRRAARDIADRMKQLRPDASLAGYTVQPMMRKPGMVHVRQPVHELVVEAVEDAVFGPVISVRPGAGREPIAVGLVPLNGALAYDMLARARVANALGKTWHQPGANVRDVAVAVARLSQLLVDWPEIAEVRIDPLLCDDKGPMALEVEVRLHEKAAGGTGRLSISPYPAQLEEHVTIAGGRVLLRAIRPEDARAYAQFVAGTDGPDIVYRFSTLKRNLPAKDLARYTQIDYDRDMAFVAVAQDRDAEEIVGEVRAIRYPNSTSAEFAILVRSDMKRRGLGRALLRKMIAYSRTSGVKELVGQVLPENEAMMALARDCGMTVETQPGLRIAVAHLDLRPAPAEPAQLL